DQLHADRGLLALLVGRHPRWPPVHRRGSEPLSPGRHLRRGSRSPRGRDRRKQMGDPVSTRTEVNAPRGFRVFRIEDPNDGLSIVKYRVEIDRIVVATITEQADMHPDYVEQTIRHSIRQL